MSAGYMLLYSHVLHLDIIYVQCVYVCVYVYIHIYIYNMSTKTKWFREALKYWIYKKMKEKKIFQNPSFYIFFCCSFHLTKSLSTIFNLLKSEDILSANL